MVEIVAIETGSGHGHRDMAIGQDTSGARAERFAAYIDDIASVLGDPRRSEPLQADDELLLSTCA